MYYLTVAKQSVDLEGLLSVVLIGALQAVRGVRANPAKMGYVDPDLYASAIKRWFDCPNYGECLDIAVRSRWSGWTCADCSVYNTLPPLKYRK